MHQSDRRRRTDCWVVAARGLLYAIGMQLEPLNSGLMVILVAVYFMINRHRTFSISIYAERRVCGRAGLGHVAASCLS